MTNKTLPAVSGRPSTSYDAPNYNSGDGASAAYFDAQSNTTSVADPSGELYPASRPSNYEVNCSCGGGDASYGGYVLF